ncbi:hypothetical protein DFP72DRAFT_855175 [Ephemerocybe angulata]|uniref:Uncharacterized protein n=1 Tax=Ephemerocybe angulata TaxID=980116 RepID=A0A8H6HHT1_9AGAR|nr:hypothetical protein DFP72DRAFT_855175 [Tulosesus angulatus]
MLEVVPDRRYDGPCGLGSSAACRESRGDGVARSREDEGEPEGEEELTQVSMGRKHSGYQLHLPICGSSHSATCTLPTTRFGNPSNFGNSFGHRGSSPTALGPTWSGLCGSDCHRERGPAREYFRPGIGTPYGRPGGVRWQRGCAQNEYLLGKVGHCAPNGWLCQPGQELGLRNGKEAGTGDRRQEKETDCAEKTLNQIDHTHLLSPWTAANNQYIHTISFIVAFTISRGSASRSRPTPSALVKLTSEVARWCTGSSPSRGTVYCRRRTPWGTVYHSPDSIIFESAHSVSVTAFLWSDPDTLPQGIHTPAKFISLQHQGSGGINDTRLLLACRRYGAKIASNLRSANEKVVESQPIVARATSAAPMSRPGSSIAPDAPARATRVSLEGPAEVGDNLLIPGRVLWRLPGGSSAGRVDGSRCGEASMVGGCARCRARESRRMSSCGVSVGVNEEEGPRTRAWAKRRGGPTSGADAGVGGAGVGRAAVGSSCEEFGLKLPTAVIVEGGIRACRTQLPWEQEWSALPTQGRRVPGHTPEEALNYPRSENRDEIPFERECENDLAGLGGKLAKGSGG